LKRKQEKHHERKSALHPAQLARDELAVSMTVRLVHGIEIERIAKTAGFRSFLSQTGGPSARRPNEPV